MYIQGTLITGSNLHGAHNSKDERAQAKSPNVLKTGGTKKLGPQEDPL
jgi:hypothetical protein